MASTRASCRRRAPPTTRAPRATPRVKASGNSSLKFTIPSNSGCRHLGLVLHQLLQRPVDAVRRELGVLRAVAPALQPRVHQPPSTPAAAAGSRSSSAPATPPGNARMRRARRWRRWCSNTYHRGFPHHVQLVRRARPRTDRTTPSRSRSARYDFKLQNARPSPYCLYSQKNTSYFPPTGNCFGYVANEWMTFQMRVKTGPRVGNEFVDSYVTLWAAREGQPSELVINWGPYNLTAGAPARTSASARSGCCLTTPARAHRSRTPRPIPGTTSSSSRAARSPTRFPHRQRHRPRTCDSRCVTPVPIQGSLSFS